jgi:hypothetical protein
VGGFGAENCCGSEYENRFIKAVRSVLTRQGTWGTHTLRKTGYLMALWGDAELEQVKLSARHKSTKSAEVYFSDAKTILNAAKLQGSVHSGMGIMIGVMISVSEWICF